ncbi:uncharacterized protein LOC131252671 [Magnolia sinica]|uniref:uncharacterized protein LOC131252671 n=1 Tax=Magnolia sinica TaxID=86752 RepID=UPI00265B5762|nr:uncharacterized protein LOC131252671 [Magnolia sinica]
MWAELGQGWAWPSSNPAQIRVLVPTFQSLPPYGLWLLQQQQLPSAMASVTHRPAAGMYRAISLLRSLFNPFYTRPFSSSSSSSSNPTTAAAATAANKAKRKKKKNLFEVAQFLPNWGIGYQMAKSHWNGISYQITKINLYKDGRHGKAWGIFHKEGLPAADAPKKISGVHKRGWRYIPYPKKTPESIPKPEVQA